MNEPKVDPVVLSEFDQAFAGASEFLDSIIGAHRKNVDKTITEDFPEAVAISALTRFLLTCPDEDVVTGLTVAVVRIERALRAGQ